MTTDKTASRDEIARRGLVGLTFDELSVGDEHWSPGRTITETDITNFSAFSGDWNPHHSDAVFAESTALGERIAHGALVVAVCSGLVVRLRLFERTIIALLEWTYAFSKPVLVGTRLQVRVRVLDKKETRNPARGIATFEVAAIDQDDEQAARGEWKVLLLRDGAE